MKELLNGQVWHFLFLALLLIGLHYFYSPEVLKENGEFFGAPTKVWFFLSIGVPVVHQVYVLVFWRLELFCRSLSSLFGEKGFYYFKIGFVFLLLLRPISIIILAVSSQNTLEINNLLRYLVSILLLLPVIYLAYSIKRCFGIEKAFGKDHFCPEEAKNWPLVDQGIFKYVSNSMYVFGFLLLWIPGLLLGSKPALVVALFSHVYIWVHYYCTEKPDMSTIYN